MLCVRILLWYWTLIIYVQPPIMLHTPEVTVAVMQELHRRGTLRSALAGRDEKQVNLLLTFVARYYFNMRSSSKLLCAKEFKQIRGGTLVLLKSHIPFSFWYQGFGIGLKQVYLLARNSFVDSMRYFTSLPNTLPVVCYFLSPWWKLYFMYSRLFDTPSTPSTFLKGGG